MAQKRYQSWAILPEWVLKSNHVILIITDLYLRSLISYLQFLSHICSSIIASALKYLGGDSFWDVYEALTTDQLRYVMARLKKSLDHHEDERAKKKRRTEASRYTADPEIREKIFERDGKICNQCGASNNLTLDHIKPVSRNGEDAEDNLQVLRSSCNSKKGTKLTES